MLLFDAGIHQPADVFTVLQVEQQLDLFLVLAGIVSVILHEIALLRKSTTIPSGINIMSSPILADLKQRENGLMALPHKHGTTLHHQAGEATGRSLKENQGHFGHFKITLGTMAIFTATGLYRVGGCSVCPLRLGPLRLNLRCAALSPGARENLQAHHPVCRLEADHTKETRLVDGPPQRICIQAPL